MYDPVSIIRQTHVMPDATAPWAIDLPQRVARHNMQWTGPALTSGYWLGGAPLGNGDLGALAYGVHDNLTFLFGKNDLWLGRDDPSRFPGKNYAQLVDIYQRGDRAAFERLMPDDANWHDRFMPSSLIQAGTLRLHLGDVGNLRALEQELSLYDATWRMKFELHGHDNMWAQSPDFQVAAFASSAFEVIGIRITRARLPLRSFTWRLGREAHRLLGPAQLNSMPSDAGVIAWFDQAMPQDGRYAIAMLQTGQDAHITTGKRSLMGEVDGEVDGEIDGEIAGVTLWVTCATHRDGDDALALARQRVAAAAAAGWDAVHGEHRRAWAAHWSRSWVATDDMALERPWYLSQYYVGSTLRAGKVSPGLQGMWCKENQPPWNADFHGNINIQAVYHGAVSSNHADLFEPYARLYHEMLPQCIADTQRYFGVAGVRFPHAGGIDGHEQTEDNWIPLAVSIYPTMWIARLFWWQYQHTHDREFLANVAYPILKDVARFLHGLLGLSRRGADGKFNIEPSIWGERDCTSLDGFGTDSSYDIVTHHAGLSQAVAAARLLDVDQEMVDDWCRALADLPDLPKDENNVWLYWRSHRTLPPIPITANSFFPPVFPAEYASVFHGDQAHRRDAVASWRFASAEQCSAWCGGVPVAAAARMGDADWCYRAASARMPINGMRDSDKPDVTQADHVTGMSFALCSMLVLGVDGVLVPFPAFPQDIDIAFHSLRAPGAVLVSGEQKGGRITHLTIQTLSSGPLRVLSPFVCDVPTAVRVTCVDDGVDVLCATVGHRDELCWQGQAQAVYSIQRA